MNHAKWRCPKCDHLEFETDQFRATGGFWSKIFDIQSKKFTTVICKQCSHTEIYRTTSSKLGNVFDFFTG